MHKTLPKGHVSCLSGAFRYTDASSTDLAKTFARVRRELTRGAQPATGNVRELPRKLGGGQPS